MALLIDLVAVAIATIVLSLVAAMIGAVAEVEPEKYAFIGRVIGLLVFWSYFAATESGAGTLGKNAMRIGVTDLAGGRIGFWRASLRQVAKLLLCFGLPVAAFTARGQALHDMIAGTLVVRRPAVKA